MGLKKPAVVKSSWLLSLRFKVGLGARPCAYGPQGIWGFEGCFSCHIRSVLRCICVHLGNQNICYVFRVPGLAERSGKEGGMNWKLVS